ncbi:MAG: 16S rRNA (cytosine(1402)-N(4))-methyltransferase RsmH, partial [Chitinivibrionales bacterium]|nr:16S rRNA (cytosine(1402)-N(4))-methyltransferase RsmH [Chitinivibrionales bacterium]
DINPDRTYLDCTLGGGGYFSALVTALDERGTAVGIDRDPDAVAWNKNAFTGSAPRVIIEQERFSQFDSVLGRHAITALDGILCDLGLSRHHIDDESRGFSYMKNNPLDMRMNPAMPVSAADILNNAGADELAHIFGDFGEVRNPHRMAETVFRYSRFRALNTTNDLKQCLQQEYGPCLKIKMLAKVFQALRIAVNDELNELQSMLEKSADFLTEGGRLVVVAYHSLEDRIVKNFMRDNERGCVCPPRAAQCTCGNAAKFKRINRKAVKASDYETGRNPAARPARLRAAIRTGKCHE